MSSLAMDQKAPCCILIRNSIYSIATLLLLYISNRFSLHKVFWFKPHNHRKRGEIISCLQRSYFLYFGGTLHTHKHTHTKKKLLRTLGTDAFAALTRKISLLECVYVWVPEANTRAHTQIECPRSSVTIKHPNRTLKSF